MDDSIEKLTRAICAFRDARDWKEFHNPKEMAVAIAAEAGELLQHFVWQSASQSQDRIKDRQSDIASEMASNCDIDLATAIRSKLARNEERYPVAKAKGSNKKYNEL
jgi:dCTP diphosphatase